MDKYCISEENERKLLSSLGLCARARALIIGAPMVIDSVRDAAKSPKLGIEASDTSENTHKRICDKCSYYGIKHIRLGAGIEALSDAVGKSSSVAAVAVSDENFYKLLMKYIES